MFHHLERARNQPEHIRRGIALGAAGALTLVVAVGWGVATISGGTLALVPTSLTSDTAPLTAAASETSSTFSNLLGAAGAAGQTDQSPSLQIVDNGTTSTIASSSADASPAPDQTVIPF